MSSKKEAKYLKYLKKVSKHISSINQKIDEHNIILSIGSFFFLLFFLIYTSYDDIKDKNARELMNSLFTYLLGGSILAQHVIKDTLYKLFENIRNSSDYDVEYDSLREQFELLKDNNLVDKTMISLFDTLESYYLTNPNEYDKKQNKSVKEYMKLLVEMNKIKEFEEYIVDKQYIKRIVEDLNNFISDYGTAKKQLNRTLIKPLLLNIMGKDSPPISAVFLCGEPGVGKTRFVIEIAKILDAKIYEYIPSVEKGERLNFYKPVKDNYDKFSVFTKMILESKHNKPIILFIDEIDKNLNKNLLNTLLEILGDPKTRKIKDKSLKVNLKILNNIIIICASNKSLEKIVSENNMYEPLLSRFMQIFIPNMSKELQYHASLKYITGIYPQINDDDKKFIKDVIDRTDYPGLRELITISNSYVSQLQAYHALKEFEDINIDLDNPNDIRENYLNEIIEQYAASKSALNLLANSPKISDEEEEEEEFEEEEND